MPRSAARALAARTVAGTPTARQTKKYGLVRIDDPYDK